MLKKYPILFLLITPLFLTSCFGRWSEARKKAFCEECEQTRVIDGISFSLTGFSFSENDSIFVLQIRDSLVVDSFYVQINLTDSSRDRWHGWIDKTIILDDVYHFVVPEEQTFVLSDMKMVMWAQFTMFSEGYGCHMAEFKIDGKLFEHHSSVDFMKTGYLFYWERE